ncbi:peptide ABC transporter ATP-binding protein [Halobacteriales archaeon SW_6_65_15]|nr:MAG: peptide ABC transporter ATP-binding protein [Halobacteriales archaeon SW_6_65_15]
MTLLSVSDLRVTFDTDRGTVQALDGVDFEVERGETLCLVGESGSGKTIACESIPRLVPTPPGDLDGEIRFDGRDLLAATDAEVRSLRGDRIAHVFQNPQGALDPVYSIGEQLVEAVQIHRDVPTEQARQRAIRLLDRVGIPDPAERIDEYPHEFSGGMKQRVVIAMALATDPDLLVADEPTTAVDVTTQSQILDLLAELQDERGMAIVFVTHDLGVAAQIADRVVVMYAGEVMERGDVYDVFDRPAHPYTRALLDCLPRRDRDPEPIEGSFPDPTDPPDGCRFHPRCPHAVAECRDGGQPPLESVAEVANGTAEDGGTPEADRQDHCASCVYYDGDHDPAVVADGENETEEPEEDPR